MGPKIIISRHEAMILLDVSLSKRPESSLSTNQLISASTLTTSSDNLNDFSLMGRELIDVGGWCGSAEPGLCNIFYSDVMSLRYRFRLESPDCSVMWGGEGRRRGQFSQGLLTVNEKECEGLNCCWLVRVSLLITSEGLLTSCPKRC